MTIAVVGDHALVLVDSAAEIFRDSTAVDTRFTWPSKNARFVHALRPSAVFLPWRAPMRVQGDLSEYAALGALVEPVRVARLDDHDHFATPS